MNYSLKKRVTVATCWSTSRISALDNVERYEDSFAITQEFREWITCFNTHPELLMNSLMMVPNNLESYIKKNIDTDEIIEI